MKYFYHLHSYTAPLPGDFGYLDYLKVVRNFFDHPNRFSAKMPLHAMELLEGRELMAEPFIVGSWRNDVRRYIESSEVKPVRDWGWMCQEEERIISKRTEREMLLMKKFGITPHHRPFELMRDGTQRYHIKDPFEFWCNANNCPEKIYLFNKEQNYANP